MLKKLAVVLSLVAGPLSTAQADRLEPGQAKTVALADSHANLYYTVNNAAYEVVITVAPGPEEGGHPTRSVSRLADGESQEVSIGGYGKNTILTTLRVSRTGDQVSFDVATDPVSWDRKTAADLLKKLAIVLPSVAAPLTTARADRLEPGQAKTMALADWYANLYYTGTNGAYEVMVTAAPGPDEGGYPMRFVNRLADGESQEVSIGGYGKNTVLTTLRVSRTGEQVSFDIATKPVSWDRKTAADFAK